MILKVFSGGTKLVTRLGQNNSVATILNCRNLSSKPRNTETHYLKAWNRESLQVHGKLLGRVSSYKKEDNISTKKRTAATKIKKPKQKLDNVPKDLGHFILEEGSSLSSISVTPFTNKMCKIHSDFLGTIEDVPLVPEETLSLNEMYDSEEEYSEHRRPSVSKILDLTMPPESRAVLERWKLNQISILGLDGFNKMQKETLERGKNLHLAIQSLLGGKAESDVIISNELSPFWNSIRHVFMDTCSVKYLEGYVIHPTLHYAGYFDCIAQFKDKLCLIDWKTSAKQKPYLSSTFDNPLQLAAYAGAVNSDPRYGIQIRECLLVIAYADGSPAHAHLISAKKLQIYWEKWLLRVKEHWQNVIPS